jgi:ribonuclease D
MLSDRPADDGAADGAALDPATAASTETDAAPAVVPLTEPADGIPPVVDTLEELARVAAAFEAGTGPVAVDAERASGYRYGQHTYLVQLRREGAGTALIDPIALPDLSMLSDALVGVEWVLHAASQDLPGLLEQNLRPSTPRVEPWRRVSGLHAIHDTHRLAVVRELWTTREENARQRDISPGRVLPDHAILAAAQALPRSVPQLVALPAFSGKGTRRRAALWQHAIDEGLALPESELPSVRGPRSDAPPPPRAWPDRDPAAAARLAAARDAVATLSSEVEVPAENLLQPDLLRRLCWSPPSPLDAASIGTFLRAGGARQWQVDVVTPRLVAAFAAATPD